MQWKISGICLLALPRHTLVPPTELLVSQHVEMASLPFWVFGLAFLTGNTIRAARKHMNCVEKWSICIGTTGAAWRLAVRRSRCSPAAHITSKMRARRRWNLIFYDMRSLLLGTLGASAGLSEKTLIIENIQPEERLLPVLVGELQRKGL